jgi:DNA-binding PadR family transcriptional regulator
MKSLRHLSDVSSAIPATADEVLEFHAARILLLISLCGTKSKGEGLSKIDGLTKMAKLDFFVRYPEFFERISAHITKQASPAPKIESSMVRHHYGPWDKRYYHVLAYLESKGLITVEKRESAYLFYLTTLGQVAAQDLRTRPPFEDLVGQMLEVKRLLGGKTGSALKKLIYEVFEEEVAQRSLGEVIT